MKLEQLIDQFELVTDTEEGFDQLREVILDFAFKGILNKQNPENEHAGKLLKRIQAEKHRLYDEGEIRKPKDPDDVSCDEIPHHIPKEWTWTNVQNLFFTISTSGKKIKKRDFLEEGEFPVIDQGQDYIGGFTNEEDKLIDIPRDVVIFGDHTREVKYVDFNFVAGADGIKIFCPVLVNAKYFYWLLKNVKLTDRGYARHFKLLKQKIVPLSPLEEQKRIVPKIETLFAQVDELEQKVEQGREVDERLQVAVLDDLQSAETPEASKQSWQRLTDNFEQVYRKPEHIDQLKQAILNEAVRGRLVSQDPNDEPAEQLLERITEEKKRLYEEGEIRKPKDLPEISEEDKPYELPKRWIWARVGDIAKAVEYGTSQKSHKEPNGVPMLRMGNIDEFGNLTLDNLKYVDVEIDDLPRLYLKDKDLLFNRTNSYELVGKMGLFHGEDDKYTFASYLIRVQLFHDLTSVEYLHNFINSENCRTVEIEPEITQQTNQANFNGTKLQHIRVPLPPLEEQKRIMEEVNRLFTWCGDIKEKLSRSQQTDKRLLEALVNGHAR